MSPVHPPLTSIPRKSIGILNVFCIQVHLKKLKKFNIFLVTHFRNWNPYITWIHYTEWNISIHFDDYGLQIRNPKLEYDISNISNISKKKKKIKNISNKCKASEKYVHFYALSTWAPFAWITASMQHGMDAISLWHCSGVMEAQVAMIAAFRSSALLGQVSLIFLLTIPHRFSTGFRSGKFAGQSSTVIPWSLNQLLVPLAVWAGAKWKIKSACQPKEAWSALKFPGSWVDYGPQKTQWTTSVAPQIIDCGHFTLDFMQHGLCSSPRYLQTLGRWFGTNDMQNLLSSEKRTFFRPLSNSPVLFLHSPGKTLLTLSLVQEWLDTGNATFVALV